MVLARVARARVGPKKAFIQMNKGFFTTTKWVFEGSRSLVRLKKPRWAAKREFIGPNEAR